MQIISPASLASTDQALFQLACALREAGYQFITATPLTHQRVNSRPGNEWARNLEGVFGWSRPFQAKILPPHIWELMQRAEIAVPHGEGWRPLVRLSSLGGQLFWHSAFPTDGADAVFFGPDTYRFALAIQTFFDSALPSVSRAVDIGCGAGPGAILTALAHPNAEVIGVDINPAALRLTRINAALAGASNLEARNSNVLNDVQGEFDLIVANPPYLVDASERAYRHGGGPLGAELSLTILDAALQRLAAGGTLLLYTGAAILDGTDPFRDAVEEKLAAFDAQWLYHEVDPDVFGEELEGGAYAVCDRITAVVLTVTKTRV